MTAAQRGRFEKLLAQYPDAPVFSDLGFLLNLVRQMDNAARGITGLTQLPITTMSQKKREYIASLLTIHGTPPPGHIHVITKGEEAKCKTQVLDEAFFPTSAVVLLIPKGGDFMDGQCYDKQGYKVYAD